MEIKSYWSYEKGLWDTEHNKYIERTVSEVKEKMLKIEIEINIKHYKNDPIQVIHFIGGPTGYESYYIKDLLENNLEHVNFCICGGTINSWAKCWVKSKDIKNILMTLK